MLRDYRWQIAAFILAMFIFGAALVTRITSRNSSVTPSPEVQPTAEVTTNAVPSDVPNTPTTETGQSTTATPAPMQPIFSDGVVTFREGLIGQPQRLNPLFSNLNPVDQDITSLIFSGLFKINQYGEPVPDLAESFVVSNDGLEYGIILRNDVLWHDGESFNADDVIYTISILQEEQFPGSRDLQRFWNTVEVEKINDTTIRFRLTQPLSAFLTNLTIGILPEHVLTGIRAEQLATHPFNFSPIGTGPYQLESINADNNSAIQQINLRVAPVIRQRLNSESAYQIERFSFVLFNTFEDASNALTNGQIDGLASRDMRDRLALLSERNVNTFTSIAPAVGVLIFNWEETDTGLQFFSDQRIRRALQQGVSITGPVETHLSNQALVADSVLLPNSWAYSSPGQPVLDVASSRDTIENTTLRAIVDEETGEPIIDTENEEESTVDPRQFTILVEQDKPAHVNIANEVASQWSQISVNVTVEAVSEDIFTQRLEAGQFDTAIVELALGADPDVYAYWHAGQYPDGMNYGAVIDDRTSEALERARRESNGVNRVELYHEFQRLFQERAIAIPLYYPLFTYAVNDAVDGVQLGIISNPTDRFRTLIDWQFSSP